MCQVLLRIPIPGLPNGIPIFGFGMMLFVAFIACTWLAGRRARAAGIDPVHIQDLALWIFIAGIVGARIVYMIQFGVPLVQFFKIWEGGLVFYGSLLGGWIGYALAYHFIIRRHGLSAWQLADILAPSIALGLCLGRVGCLLNGCCYGNVACSHCPDIHFPLPSPPRYALVERGWQTAAGFTMSETAADGRTVGAVEPGSPAAESGLKPGDIIIAINGHSIKDYKDLLDDLVADWPRGQNDLSLTVLRDEGEAVLPAFVPRTIGLHPTQLYETISMALLFLLLLAYEPFQSRYGEVLIVFLLGYAMHRFLNEALRNDTPPPLRDFLTLPNLVREMTLSQLISVLVFAVAVGLSLWLRRQPIVRPPATT